MLHKPVTSKPLIGITTGEEVNPFTLFMLKNGVRLAGGNPVHISPALNVDKVRDLNGLIVSGGGDIDPALYGQSNIASRNIEPARDRLESECVEMAYDGHLPILGICRGAQLLNVKRGGTLHQDAGSVFNGFMPTESLLGKIVTRRKVEVSEHSRLSRILENNMEVWVNSLHHQAQAKIGEGLREVACDKHGITQAIESEIPYHFALGVQWHPEFMLYSNLQRRIFKALVAASLPTIPTAAEEERIALLQNDALNLQDKAA